MSERHESILEEIWDLFHRHKHRHYNYELAIFFHHHHNHHHMPTTSLTLTDLNPHVGVLSVIDATTGAVIPGTISNVAETVSDPSQDTATTDATNPNAVDVTAVTNTGSSVLGVTADFTSTDGTVSITGLSLSLPITNNVTVTPPPPQPTLVIDFGQ